MPVCYITVSENCKQLNTNDLEYIRRVIAKGMTSKSRFLDENHISVRIQKNERKLMLSDIEIEIFCQLYSRRIFSRDRRANTISRIVSNHYHCGCATWINMSMVGYSRADSSGDNFYSDSDNRFVRVIQRIRGIASSNVIKS